MKLKREHFIGAFALVGAGALGTLYMIARFLESGDFGNAAGGFVFLLILGAAAYVGWKEFQKHERREADLARERSALAQVRLDALESGTTIGELNLNETTFRRQKGESIYGAVLCYRKQLKTETTGVTFGGPSVRIKIAKGIYYRAGSYRGTKHTEDVVRALGAGWLVITNKRLVFRDLVGSGNWTRRWETIVGWQVEGSTLVVETTSGRPMLFDTNDVGELPAHYVDDDPRVLNRIMEIASGEQPALESEASPEQLN